MVLNSTIIYLVISTILCFGFPILLFLILNKRSNKLWFPLLGGIVGFFVMQVVIRMPILSILGLYTGFYEVNIFLLAFILAFTAALFETFGRVVTVKLFMKNNYRFYAGLAHGIGHGGIEAIILVGANYIVYVIFAVMINNGVFDTLVNLDVSFQSIEDLLILTTPSLFLLGGIERVLTIVFHMAMSVLVVYAFRIKKKYPVIMVVVLHTLLDFSIVLMSHYGLDTYLIELYILIVAVLMIGLMYYIHKQYLNLKVVGELDD